MTAKPDPPPPPTPSRGRAAPEPWERQPGESIRAFAHFRAYRDLGPGRSHAKVGQSAGVSTQRIDELGRKWGWQARVRAWEAEQDRARRAAQLEEIRAMGERQAREAAAIQEVCLAPVRAFLERARAGAAADPLAGLSPPELLRLLPRVASAWSVAMKAERLARGAPAGGEPAEAAATAAPRPAYPASPDWAEVERLFAKYTGVVPRDSVNTRGGVSRRGRRRRRPQCTWRRAA